MPKCQIGDYFAWAKEPVVLGNIRRQRGKRLLARGVTFIVDAQAEGTDKLLEHDGYRDSEMADFVRPPSGRTAEDTAAILGGVPRGAIAGIVVGAKMLENPEVGAVLGEYFPDVPDQLITSLSLFILFTTYGHCEWDHLTSEHMSIDRGIKVEIRFGKPAEDIPYNDYVRDVVIGNREIDTTAMPPTIQYDGKDYPLTANGIAQGIVMVRQRDAQLTSGALHEIVHGDGLEDDSCCAVNWRTSGSVVADKPSCGRAIFGGFAIRTANGTPDDQLVMIKACPSRVADADLPTGIETSSGLERFRELEHKIVVPAVIPKERLRELVDKAEPKNEKEAAVLIKDLVKNFCEGPKIQTYWTDGMADGWSENEPRHYLSDDVLNILADLNDTLREKLGDDYSYNACTAEIAKRLFGGELKINYPAANEDDADEVIALSPRQLGAVWLHVHAAREYAKRTSRKRYY